MQHSAARRQPAAPPQAGSDGGFHHADPAAPRSSSGHRRSSARAAVVSLLRLCAFRTLSRALQAQRQSVRPFLAEHHQLASHRRKHTAEPWPRRRRFSPGVSSMRSARLPGATKCTAPASWPFSSQNTLPWCSWGSDHRGRAHHRCCASGPIDQRSAQCLTLAMAPESKPIVQVCLGPSFARMAGRRSRTAVASRYQEVLDSPL